MAFVGRERELYTLKRYLNDVRGGAGRVVLIEGPAGIGKTALVDEFLRDVSDVQVLKSRVEPSSSYIPYYAISQAFGEYGTLREIRRNEWKRMIAEIAERLAYETKMIFVDEIGYGGGYRIYKELSKRIKGEYFTIRKPWREDAIWLTETETDVPKINPYDLEFKLTSQILDFLQVNEKRAVYIENINYLIYLVGIDRVVDFLHTLRSIAQDTHIVIVSGKMEYLTENERKLIEGIFDEKLLVEWEDEIRPSTIVLVDSLPENHVFRVVDRRIKNEKMVYVSPQGTHPSRLDFEIFEKISEAIDSGMDVSIECLGTLIHYNDKRSVYIWLKALGDYASKNGRKIYILQKPSLERDIEFFLDLIDEGKEKMYGTGMVDDRKSFKFYETIFRFLHNNSRRNPFLVIFEDIQWIDVNSLELIHYLARNIGESKIMLLLTYRSEDVVINRNIIGLLTKLQDERNVYIIRLKPLRKMDIENLLSSLDVDVDFDAIYEASEGNPLLAINMARYFAMGMESGIPDTIRESIEMQIDELDEAHLNFIRFLSVVGNEAPLELVEDFYPEYGFFMEKLGKFFLKQEGKNLRFAYSPYREVVYRGISRDTRMEIHRRIGEWAHRKGALFLAAYHYYMARDERAITFLKMAAEESVNMLAFKSAIEYLQKAVEIALKYGKKESLGELYRSLGEWYIATGEYERAVNAFNDAMKYDPKSRILYGIKIGMCYRLMGSLEIAMETLEKYLDEAKNMERARIIGELGIINWERGNFTEALKNLKEYLDYSRKHQSGEDEVRALRNIASVHYMEGDYRRAIKYALRALKVAEEVGDIRELAETYNILGVVNNHLANYKDALEYLMKFLEISEKIGNMDYLSRAYNNIGVTYEKLGDMRKAEEYYKKSLKVIEKLGNYRLLEGFYNNIGILQTRHGNYQEGLNYLNRSLELAIKINNVYGMCEHYISLGEVYTEMGKYYEAIDSFIMAIEIAKKNSYVTLLFSAYLYLSRAYIYLGESRKVREYLELAHSLKNNVQEEYLLMDYYVVNGEYEAHFGNGEMGLKWLSRAKDIARRINDMVNMTYVEVLEAYLICDENSSKAKKMFERAIKVYEELDYKNYVADTYRYYALCLRKVHKGRAKDILLKARKLYEEAGLTEKIMEADRELSEILS